MSNLSLEAVTVDQVLASDRKEYNAYEWSKKVKMYAGFPKCQFYRDRNQEKDTFYVVYQADGINFFKEFGYISCLSSTGFVYVYLEADGSVRFNGTGADRDKRIANCNENRPMMRNLSSHFGTIFTNEF